MTRAWAEALTNAHQRRGIQTMAVIEADEARAGLVVQIGDPSHEIAMHGMPPMILGALEAHMGILSSALTTPAQKRASAEMLIRSSHRPHRIAAAPYLRETAQ